MTDDRRSLLARAWDEAAAGYDRYLVPRFEPWLTAAVRAVPDLPPGPIVVPCCGPFPELPALRRLHPGRELVGVDLSAGMVDMARERAAGNDDVRVVQGDATTLGPVVPEGAAAVVSVFGLQQLPDPPAAIADWASVLRPSGRLSVVFWPSDSDSPDGPFTLMRRVLASRRPAPDLSWEHELIARITSTGATVDRDEELVFPMSHPDAETVFAATTEGGASRALAIERGPEFMAEVRAEFLAQAPAGEWRHYPRARLIVAQARAVDSAGSRT